jgi:hypothetical protein
VGHYNCGDVSASYGGKLFGAKTRGLTSPDLGHYGRPALRYGYDAAAQQQHQVPVEPGCLGARLAPHGSAIQYAGGMYPPTDNKYFGEFWYDPDHLEMGIRKDAESQNQMSYVIVGGQKLRSTPTSPRDGPHVPAPGSTTELCAEAGVATTKDPGVAAAASGLRASPTTMQRTASAFCALIPLPTDQNRYAQSRNPMEIMRHGWSTSLFQASQQCSTTSS